jgi:sporulation protein YlmC with PRC-barrel domain
LAQVFASRLRGMNVLTDRGLQVGRLLDMLVDEESGRIISLVVKPITREALGNLPKDPSGNALLHSTR